MNAGVPQISRKVAGSLRRSAEAAGHYAALLESGGFGRFPHERAAFLIRESGGAITLAPWEELPRTSCTLQAPALNGVQSASAEHEMKPRPSGWTTPTRR